MHLPIKMLTEDLPLPSYAHSGDAGLDLRSACDAEIAPFERVLIPCGFAMALPEGYAGLVLPRSGLGSKHGITLANSPGLIDSGYRGEIKVPLQNLDPHETFAVRKGDRIAQMVIIETPAVTITDEWPNDKTDRGINGFGSSGIAS